VKYEKTCVACSNETYQGTVLDKGDVEIVPMGDSAAV
jgi:hypothetical protein